MNATVQRNARHDAYYTMPLGKIDVSDPRLYQVAYIRFTSVYRNFREAKDFGEFVERIAADGD
jgi:transcriptional regulator NrdR family protein